MSRRTGFPQPRQNKLRRPREEEFQVVVQLRHRADGRARGLDGIGLVDGDGGRDAVDAVGLRLVHAVEELPRVRRKRLDVAPLSLGINRVECQRRFARPADPRDDDQFTQRQLEIDALEIVLPRALH